MRGIYGLDEQLLASQGRLRVLNLASRPLIVTVCLDTMISWSLN